MNRKERKRHKLRQRKNEEAKSGIGAVRCAQRCRKYTPKGGMGHFLFIWFIN